MARQISYSYEHVPTIAAWSEDYLPMLRGLMGPFGSAKSSGCCAELVRIASRQVTNPDTGKRHARFAIIRNSYVELRDTTLKTFMEWFPEPQFGRYVVSDHVYYMTGIDGLDIEVLFRALDRPEQVKNLLSLELTAAWVNEAKEVPYPIIEALTGRVGRYPSRNNGGCVSPCVIMDTNPPDDESWWYKLFEVRKPKDAVIYKQPSGLSEHAENLPNLPEDYYRRMADIMDKDKVEVYVNGRYGFIRSGKPVYPDYVDEIHCAEFEVNENVDRIYYGWDFGLKPSCEVSQVVDGQWRTFHEFALDEMDSIDIHSFADRVINEMHASYPWIKGRRIKATHIGDPAGIARTAVAQAGEAATSFAVLRGKGIDIQPGDQAIKLRLDSVTYALKQINRGKPLLLIHPRCQMLRKGYQGRYSYRKVQLAGAEERFHEEPDKNMYSHPHDANQYVAARLFGAMVKSREDRAGRWKSKIEYPPSGLR